MEKMYWDQFLHSGKIKDYLSYKNCIADVFIVSLQNEYFSEGCAGGRQKY